MYLIWRARQLSRPVLKSAQKSALIKFYLFAWNVNSWKQLFYNLIESQDGCNFVIWRVRTVPRAVLESVFKSALIQFYLYSWNKTFYFSEKNAFRGFRKTKFRPFWQKTFFEHLPHLLISKFNNLTFGLSNKIRSLLTFWFGGYGSSLDIF